MNLYDVCRLLNSLFYFIYVSLSSNEISSLRYVFPEMIIFQILDGNDFMTPNTFNVKTKKKIIELHARYPSQS